MANPSPVLSAVPLDFVWQTVDPFLFCVHHDDAYPVGNAKMGPAASLAGRNLGQDFTVRDGWRMYHGHTVPGFPQHPHRGFETVTVLRKGYVDHSDSLGATARFGPGDAQWMTAGRGIVHAEMFPLLDGKAPNPVELFQIWINLPPGDKMVPPHFSMSWSENIPVRRAPDADGRETVLTVVAGRLGEDLGAPPPPHSWAAKPENDVAIVQIVMPPGGRYTLPAPTASGVLRNLYLFRGSAQVPSSGARYRSKTGLSLAPAEVTLEAGPEGAEWLLLQGKPIGAPVAQYGPFVMNSRAEIEQAFADYQRTRFGGWPWASDDPVHPRDSGRFAKHADGRTDTPGPGNSLSDGRRATDVRHRTGR